MLNWQGMVVVENATLIPVTTQEELDAIVAKGFEKRHTSCTQMNSESSRSHLILSVIIESTNLQSQVLLRGKVKFLQFQQRCFSFLMFWTTSDVMFQFPG